MQHTSDKELASRIYKEFPELNNKKTNDPIFEVGTRFEQFIKENIWMGNKHIKCSKSFIIREIPTKTTMRYHYTPIRMAKAWKTEKTKCW